MNTACDEILGAEAETRGGLFAAIVQRLVRRDNAIIDGLLGYYAWDGETCPIGAAATIDTIYGSGG